MAHPVDQHVGNKLKKARVLRRLSQTDIARQVSISFQQVQKYETGANRISASRLFEFSQILNVAPSFFFEGLNDTSNETQADDAEMSIISAVSAIKDERTKDRVLALIKETSGAGSAHAA